MSADLAIESMTLTEKLALMERLWIDLSRRPEDIPSPEWHGEVLAERIAAVREGRTEFVDWDAAKKRLRDRLESKSVSCLRLNMILNLEQTSTSRSERA